MTKDQEDIIIELRKEWLPIWCEICDRQGYIFIDDRNNSYYVICKGCGSEYSQVWCPECGMGGDYARDIDRHPSSWICLVCKNEYSLSPEFYKKPVSLYLEDMLSEEILDRIKNTGKFRPALSPGKIIKTIALLIILLALFIGPLFLPLVLVPAIYKLLNMRSDTSVTAACTIVWLPIWIFLFDKFRNPLTKSLFDWAYKNSD